MFCIQIIDLISLNRYIFLGCEMLENHFLRLHGNVLSLIGNKGSLIKSLAALRVSSMVKRSPNPPRHANEFDETYPLPSTSNTPAGNPSGSKEAKKRTKSSKKSSKKTNAKKNLTQDEGPSHVGPIPSQAAAEGNGNAKQSDDAGPSNLPPAPPGFVWRLVPIDKDISTPTSESSFQRDHLAEIRKQMLNDKITEADFTSDEEDK